MAAVDMRLHGDGFVIGRRAISDGQVQHMQREMRQAIKEIERLRKSTSSPAPPSFSPPSPRTPTSARKLPSLPVIDFAHLHEPSHQPHIMQQLVQAAEDWGCFRLVNHGISTTLLDAVMKVTKQFFRTSEANKMRVQGAVGLSYKVEGADTDKKREILRHNVCPLASAQPETWPNNPRAYRNLATLYSQRIAGLANSVLMLLSEGLGLSSDSIIQSMGPTMTARLLTNSYDQSSAGYNLPSHTDPNTLTFLLEDQGGALDVYRKSTWVPVRSLPEETAALTVLIGDHLQVVSNGKWRSIIHRVRISPKQTSNLTSIGIYFAPSWSKQLRCAPELVDENHPTLYKPITFKEYLLEYYKPGRDQTSVCEYFRS